LILIGLAYVNRTAVNNQSTPQKILRHVTFGRHYAELCTDT